MRYGFKNTVLKSNQVSLTDNWDGESKELRTKSKNPYLSGYFKNDYHGLIDYQKKNTTVNHHQQYYVKL